MAYTRFSTDNADYVLELGNHSFENHHDCYDGIDALVVENVGLDLRGVLSLNHPQLRRPLQNCSENRTPIFGVDIYSDEDDRFFLRNLPIFLTLHYYGYRYTGQANDLTMQLCDFWNRLFPGPEIVGRNVVNARKIEEYVAPLVGERIGRKPSIGLVYGAAHLGLKRDITDKTLRDLTLSELEAGRWKGLEIEKLNVVYEANHDGKQWHTTKHRVSLF